jgi:hypothetical protein
MPKLSITTSAAASTEMNLTLRCIVASLELTSDHGTPSSRDSGVDHGWCRIFARLLLSAAGASRRFTRS